MAKDAPQTVGQLLRAGLIRNADIDAVVSGYLSNPGQGMQMLGRSGYRLDPAAAVRGHRQTRAALADKTFREKYRQVMVRTAILLAFPIEP